MAHLRRWTELGKKADDGFWLQRQAMGRLGKAQDHTRKDGERSGMLEFSLGALNCGCGRWVQRWVPWFCSSAKASGKDGVAGEVQRWWQ